MYSIRLRMTELEKLERDMLLLGKLKVCARTASATVFMGMERMGQNARHPVYACEGYSSLPSLQFY